MARALLSLACHLYGAAALVYLAYLARPLRGLALSGRSLVGLGLLLHATALGSVLRSEAGVPSDVWQGFVALAAVLLAIFFLVDLRYRLPVLGAFIVPLSLAMLVPGLVLRPEGNVLPPHFRQPLLPLHVAVALVGLAAFAAAVGVGVAYLLMEREVKGKRFGPLFSRLPPLETLDELNRSLVIWGFVALTIALLSGAFFAQSAGVYWRWDFKEVATVAAWMVFAGVIAARSFAGWRGRRVAWLTMAGFAFVLLSFLSTYGSVVPGAGVR